LLLAPISASAMGTQEYDARLCSAQLIVLKGDLRQFLNPTTSENHRNGYQQRIAGALGTINWLCRHYAFLHKFSFGKLKIDINELLDAFNKENWNKAGQKLDTLIEKMPLSLKGLKPEKATPEAIQTGKEIYKDYCQACHKQPELNLARPAYSLFKMAKKLSQKEFIARMIVGVHGTPEIALQNPLTDDDIAGMFAYLLRENN
jgi:mono/diheme cytochrome c family protein